MAKRFTIAALQEAKRTATKIVAVSCYDFTTARLICQADVDMLLVGDSAAQVMLGYQSTLPATMDFMVTITAAVRRAAPDQCLVADMPFLSYQIDRPSAIRNAARFVVEAGADIVKMEVSDTYIDTVKAVVDAGIAVMAHIGIRPQYVAQTGALRAQATTAQLAVGLLQLAESVVKAGACCILLEGTAAEVAGLITSRSTVPVIGCGSGPDCDGQVLIAADILGLTSSRPRFAASFADLASQYIDAVAAYSRHIRTGTFPDHDHCYHMKPGELERLHQLLTISKPGPLGPPSQGR